MTRTGQGWIHMSGRLFEEYIVNAYCRIEGQRLNWYRHNQKKIRAELYQGLVDASRDGQDDSREVGRRIVLGPHFTGGPRYMTSLYQDAMAMVRAEGKPTLFITMTCNPKWPEITDALFEHQQPVDRPDIIARVFWQRARCLIHDLTVKNGLGKAGSRDAAKGWLWVIEWQKRGLPHLHLLLWLHESDIPREAHDFDELICAEIPDPTTEKAVHDLVVNHMIHGPCGDLAACAASSYTPPCFDEKKGVCDKHFPKPFFLQTVDTEDGYPLYRRRPPNPSSGLQEDTGHTAEVRGVQMDNRWVVPYNKPLLLKYNCHLNVEFCRSVKCVKYLNKYVYKGPDRAMAKVVSEDAQGNIDEIQDFVDGRYISSGEAVWHLLDFPLNGCSHNVERLACHLENHQSVSFDPAAEPSVNNIIQAGPPKTTLTAFFEYNTTPPARLHPGESPHTLLYHEFPRYYTFNNSTKTWKLRDRVKKALDRGRPWANAGVEKAVGRVHWASPSQGERFFLRLCLIHQKGATSFDDLKTVGGVTYPTYREAGVALGVVMDDNEWRDALSDADLWATPAQLRDLFCVILAYNAPADPPGLWNAFKDSMSDDFRHQRQQQQGVPRHVPFPFTAEDYNCALRYIDDRLAAHSKSLRDFSLPVPPPPAAGPQRPRVVQAELDFNPAAKAQYYSTHLPLLNAEQRALHDAVMTALTQQEGAAFFLDAPAGTGKTFTECVCLSGERQHGNPAIAVASTGIAATLLPLGTTAHSRFGVPLEVDDETTYCPSKNSATAQLIRMARLVVWDEITMTKKQIVAAVKRWVEDVRGGDEWGGMVWIFSGDWRQCLPVIPNSPRTFIVSSTLKRWQHWPSFKIFRLTQNMRVQRLIAQGRDASKQQEWAELLLRVEDGVGGNTITLPASLRSSASTHIEFIIEIFGDLTSGNIRPEIVATRAILAPKNDDTNEINRVATEMYPGAEREYKSVDVSSDPEMGHLLVPEFLNGLQPSGLPPHKLRLKRFMPLILIRNLNKTRGLANGTRLILLYMGDKYLQCRVITGPRTGKEVLIPRLNLETEQKGKQAFKFHRRQFPVLPAFALTINRSQGQTLERMGLCLASEVFAHGQGYVALSRCGEEEGAKIFNPDEIGWITPIQFKNVVYEEILQ
uniref:ATP-dependent DNA helicase n=1 Tax=Chromera velia CCMP2878 TaxID=1169474 RepID=A0A0G4HEZ5_9ALVE|eukprot:Cvel_6546.t1-p1 / transcript=Cvel_6546.t1 / gene=Cvel_6546 / organism=Chromera_velia_CCMP2878 / gene_product=ATP-dependent DNA helicase PIF1, putative / transcript_product=ATP-dependent DNA helicase PIF1, putative / location=Cvel_scaffold322:45774-49398(+) / protein_length=1141 / sequence_SO=supercontig / SO=protein_coding / is_pseudo=false